MNKLSLVFCLFLVVSVSAGGFEDFLNKLNNGLNKVSAKTTEVADKVNQYAGATEKTLKIATNIVESISKDLKTVSDDVKSLAKTFENEFNALYVDAMKIVEKTKNFINIGYKDGQVLFKDLSKQLSALIASAQADVDRAVAAAKTTIAQLSSDVRIVYSNGKIVAKQIQDNADLNQAIADVKAQNKEALDKTIATINDALNKANAIIASANASLKTYQSIAEKHVADAKTGANKITAEMQAFVTSATKQIEAFKAAQEKTLKNIMNDAEALYKSSKTVVEKATSTLDKAVDLYNKNAEAVSAGSAEIEKTWSKEGLKSQTGATSADLKKITDTVNQATSTVKGITDEAQKVTTVLSSTETALNDVSKSVSAELKNISFKVTAEKLNVRAGAGTKFEVVRTLNKNDVVNVIGQSGVWSQIGEKQWVSSKFLKVSDKNAAKESATKISTAIESTLNSLKGLFKTIGK